MGVGKEMDTDKAVATNIAWNTRWDMEWDTNWDTDTDIDTDTDMDISVKKFISYIDWSDFVSSDIWIDLNTNIVTCQISEYETCGPTKFFFHIRLKRSMSDRM